MKIKLSLSCILFFMSHQGFSTPLDTKPTNLQKCVQRFDPQVDYFPEKLQPEMAKRFTVSYHQHYKIVDVSSIQGAITRQFRYILVQCGTPKPQDVQKALVVEIPVRKYISVSTTHLSFLDQLDVLDGLLGIGVAEHVTNLKVRQLLEAKKVAEVGAHWKTLDLETILALNADILMASTINPTQEGFGKVLELGIPFVADVSYIEELPLGSKEWIKFFALFFNQEAKAKSIFAHDVAQYQRLANITRGLKQQPTVLTGAPFKGVWWIPGGQSYLAILLKDAGANYLWQDTPGRNNQPLDIEVVLNRAADADYWINTSDWRSLAEARALDSRYQYFKAFRTKHVYNNNARLNPFGGNDYFESGLANPHLILADLIKIFHPDLLPEHQLLWYHPLP